MTDSPSENRRHHVTHIRERLSDLIHQCRDDAARMDEREARGILLTTAEVLSGLEKILLRYESGGERTDDAAVSKTGH